MGTKRLTMAKKRYSFREAYECVPFCKMGDVRDSIKEALGISSNVTFCIYKNKGLTPSKDAYDRVEDIFSAMGIHNCWQEVGN